MATGDGENDAAGDAEGTAALARMQDNLARVEALTQRLMTAMQQGRSVPEPLQGPSQDLYAKAGAAYVQEWMANPAKIIEQQMGYWSKTVTAYVEAQQAMVQGIVSPVDDAPRDRRFANPMWDTHPWFSYVRQQYLVNAEAVKTAVDAVEGLDPRERKRLEYFSRQIVDLLSPTNFLATNPDALERAVETEGESLVQGLENLIADMEAHDGDLVVTLADREAFEVGGNIATTPGEVVFRNRLFELIQYAPATERVHTTPLVIFPPWINKFYILDLKAQNSLIKWIVDQGYTLFVVSWKNPDASYSDVSLDDYVEEGFLTALQEVREVCGVKKVNAVGYCIAGTTLSLTLALMKTRKLTGVNAATFFTTLTDFSDQGEVGVFLDDDFVDGIEEEVARAGVLDSFYMSRTFSYLRSNDLIYGPAIRSYMMGQAPPAFDLLYWNGDGTNLPARMAVQYLRGLCQEDRFAKGGFEICGELVRLRDVTVPLCAIACETDHIAAWTSSYDGIAGMGSTDKTFILSGSGHIAGIVNPPAKKKYGHWVNDDLTGSAADWRAGADAHEGSWWPLWEAWLSKRSGRMRAARMPGEGGRETLGAAPGTYVVEVPVAKQA